MNPNTLIDKMFDEATKKGFSAYRIAQELDLSVVAVYQWKKHQSDPTLFNLFCFAELIGVEIKVA